MLKKTKKGKIHTHTWTKSRSLLRDSIEEAEGRKLIKRKSFYSKRAKGKFWLEGRARKRKDRNQVL